MHSVMENGLYEALKKLRDHIPRLADLLKLGNDEEIGFWNDIVDAKLLSRLAPDFPVVAAICGGGSSGKSTLFNSLVGEHFAPTGGKAGLNRRVLFSIPARRAKQTDLLVDLARPFKDVPALLKDKDELTVPGKPLYLPNYSALNNLVILDTPCTSTGTFRPDHRMALATPRSSPKFGSVTRMPSILSWFSLNRSAHFCASSADSTAPNLVAVSDRITAPIPRDSRLWRISLRPDSHKWSGKNPRLPIMMPSVVTASRRENEFARLSTVWWTG